MMRIPTCARCGSTNIICEATARFNPASDSWELDDLYDDHACIKCEHETKDPTWIDQPCPAVAPGFFVSGVTP